jgi:hypothetical protein
MSWTRVFQFMARAQASGRPVRILYISDFDPSGANMPVAVARKIEFLNRTRNLGLDIQVRPVVLTHAQTVEDELPRVPLKDTVRGKDRFEERFGAGATELDALEALHPGALEQILVDKIERYHDGGLDDRVEEAADDFRDTLEQARDAVLENYQDELDAIQDELGEVAKKANAEIAEIRKKHASRYAEIVERFNSTQALIRDDLVSESPDPAEIEWPEPAKGDEDENPMFDSTRGYVEQMDRYKEHQDKPTAGPASYWGKPEAAE